MQKGEAKDGCEERQLLHDFLGTYFFPPVAKELSMFLSCYVVFGG